MGRCIWRPASSRRAAEGRATLHLSSPPPCGRVYLAVVHVAVAAVVLVAVATTWCLQSRNECCGSHASE